MKQKVTAKEAITPAQYRAFQEAYDFFNADLFGGSLPPVLVTLQRHAKARGDFAPGRTDYAIMSTLAHEMAPVWQQGQWNTILRR